MLARHHDPIVAIATGAARAGIALLPLRAFSARRSGFPLWTRWPWLAICPRLPGLSGLAGWARFPGGVGAIRTVRA